MTRLLHAHLQKFKPRLATDVEAAEAIGIEVSTFRNWVSCGLMPGPLRDCNKFDLKAIDVALDRISGLGSPGNALDAWRERHTEGEGDAR
jgi:hypothetical protein